MSAPKNKPPKPEKPIEAFATQKDFRAWLKKNHASSQGIWLQLAKKGAAEEEPAAKPCTYSKKIGPPKPSDEPRELRKPNPESTRPVVEAVA